MNDDDPMTTYQHIVKAAHGKVNATVTRIYAPNGQVSSVSSETVVLTPDEARVFAADLVRAAACAEAQGR